MRRARISQGSRSRAYRKGSRVHKKNVRPQPMRGGWRL